VERDEGEGTTNVGKENPFFPQFFAFDTNSKEKDEREIKRRNSAKMFFMSKNKDELAGRKMENALIISKSYPSYPWTTGFLLPTENKNSRENKSTI